MLALNRKFQNAIWDTNQLATPASNNWGTVLTAHATPHSKGAWATLVTTAYDTYGFWLGMSKTFVNTNQTDMMVDIAIGPNQENIIVPEFLCGWRNTPGAGPYWQFFPIFIPKGVLVSGRIQALITVDTLDLLYYGNAGISALPVPLFSGCDAYGTDISTSQGTSHTPGNTGAESTAANIGATTSRAYSAVMLSQNGTLSNTTMNNAAYHWELQIGAVTVCEWFSYTNSTECVFGPSPPVPFYVSIPASTQLQIRGECSGTGQAQDVAFYCFY